MGNCYSRTDREGRIPSGVPGNSNTTSRQSTPQRARAPKHLELAPIPSMQQEERHYHDPPRMGKMQEVESLMAINDGERYLSIADCHNRIVARIIGRVEAAELIRGKTPKVTYRRETDGDGQVSRNGGRFGLMPREFVDQMLGRTINIANDGFGEYFGWPYLQPYSNNMPQGRLVCCLMAKPEDILALCLFRYGFSEIGIEDRYSCDYLEVNTGDSSLGFGVCARYQEQGVALPVQKVELFSEVDTLYWDSNHISHLWV